MPSTSADYNDKSSNEGPKLERLHSVEDPEKDFSRMSDEQILYSFAKHLGPPKTDKFIKIVTEKYKDEAHDIFEQVRNKPKGTTAADVAVKEFFKKILTPLVLKQLDYELDLVWEDVKRKREMRQQGLQPHIHPHYQFIHPPHIHHFPQQPPHIYRGPPPMYHGPPPMYRGPPHVHPNPQPMYDV